MPTRLRVTSPDRDVFQVVSNLLSRNGVSVMAVNIYALTHTITSQVSPKLTSDIEELGAEWEIV